MLNSELMRITSELTRSCFIQMINPLYQKENFNFQTYDIFNYVKVRIHLYYEGKPTKEEMQEIKETTEFIWRNCLEESNILNWYHLVINNI